MLEIITILMTIAAYFIYKSEEDKNHTDKKIADIDNARMAYDMSHGVSLTERKRRLAAGYYAKM